MSKMKNIDFEQYMDLTPQELRALQKKKGWPMYYIGWIVYGVLRLFGNKPKDYKGICPYFEIGKGWGGLEMGWFFICSKNVSEHTKMHEVGHGIQNAAVGGFTMVCYSLGSAARYWWRTIFGAKTPYDSWFFEGDASKWGREYVQRFEKKQQNKI